MIEKSQNYQKLAENYDITVSEVERVESELDEIISSIGEEDETFEYTERELNEALEYFSEEKLPRTAAYMAIIQGGELEPGELDPSF